MSNSIQFTVHPEKQDLKRYAHELLLSINLRMGILAGAFGGTASQLFMQKLYIPFITSFIGYAVAAIAIYAFLKIKNKKRIRKDKPTLFFKPLHFNLNSSNVKIWNDINSTNCEWSDIKEVSQDKLLIYIWLDDVTAQIIPKRQIENPEALYTQLENWFEASRTTSNKEC